MATAKKGATIEPEITPAELGDVFATETEGSDFEDEGDDDEYEDETEVTVAAVSTPVETPVAADGKKTRKSRAPLQYIATDSKYEWVLKVEASSVRAATKKVLETPDLGLQAGSSLIIAEIKLDTELRVTFGV